MPKGHPDKPKRHRIILDITFRKACSTHDAIEDFLHAIHNMDTNIIQMVRPYAYEKTFKLVNQQRNREIQADIETAMDALREARRRVI